MDVLGSNFKDENKISNDGYEIVSINGQAATRIPFSSYLFFCCILGLLPTNFNLEMLKIRVFEKNWDYFILTVQGSFGRKISVLKIFV